MTAAVRDREAAAIAVLVALCGPDGPDEWLPEHYAAGEAAAVVAAEWVRRDGRAAAADEPKAPRPKQKRPKPDPPELTAAKKIVHERSRGICEHCHDQPARDTHHLAGRGWSGCHHPDLLLHLCGHGNIDGCHGLAHSLGKDAAVAAGLRVDRGEAQALYRDSWPVSVGVAS